jgi:hypothetical protein
MNLLQAISAASLLVLVPSGVSSAGEMLRLRHNGGGVGHCSSHAGRTRHERIGFERNAAANAGRNDGWRCRWSHDGNDGPRRHDVDDDGGSHRGSDCLPQSGAQDNGCPDAPVERFCDTLRANAQRMREMRTTMMQGGMMSQGGAAISAPDRLDRMEKMMTAMTETLRTTKASLTALYAVLTDDQKKTGDQLIHGPMGMGPM